MNLDKLLTIFDIYQGIGPAVKEQLEAVIYANDEFGKDDEKEFCDVVNSQNHNAMKKAMEALKEMSYNAAGIKPLQEELDNLRTRIDKALYSDIEDDYPLSDDEMDQQKECPFCGGVMRPVKATKRMLTGKLYDDDRQLIEAWRCIDCGNWEE